MSRWPVYTDLSAPVVLRVGGHTSERPYWPLHNTRQPLRRVTVTHLPNPAVLQQIAAENRTALLRRQP